MATSKPDILIILLQKLMEEGNVMYKVSAFVSVCAAAAVGVGPPLSLVLDAAATLLCAASRNLAGMQFQNVPT